MQIIPVIDVLNDLVVRGVAGRRAEYRPIVSQLVPDAAPAPLARLLAEYAPELYVADLDAIQGGDVRWRTLEGIVASGAEILLDAGVGTVERAREVAAFTHRGAHLGGVVVGLESVHSPAGLPALFAAGGGRARAIFSLDLKQGTPLCSPAWTHLDCYAIAELAMACGFQRLIVLDLDDVGGNRGTRTLPLCRELRQRYPHVNLVSGGGVRDTRELDALGAAGCDGALVASALHAGRLSLAEVAAAARRTSSAHGTSIDRTRP